MLVNLATLVISALFRAHGPNSKARAGGAAGALIGGAVPVVSILYDYAIAAANAFGAGFTQGTIPSIEELGQAVGAMVASYVIGYAITWLSNKNEERKKARAT